MLMEDGDGALRGMHDPQRREITASAWINLQRVAIQPFAAPRLRGQVLQAQDGWITWVGNHFGNGLVEAFAAQFVEVIAMEFVVCTDGDLACC